MKVQFYQERAHRIIAFFQSNNNNIKATIDHFKKENVPQRSIRDIIKRYLDEGRTEFKKKTGRPASVNTKRE